MRREGVRASTRWRFVRLREGSERFNPPWRVASSSQTLSQTLSVNALSTKFPTKGGSLQGTLENQFAKNEKKKTCLGFRNSIFMAPVFKKEETDVPIAKRELEGSEVRVCAVVGFPHGANRPEVKALEAKLAIEDGASELGMVMNIGRFLSGEYSVDGRYGLGGFSVC